MFYTNKNKRHFRDRRTKNNTIKTKHPHYIIGEDENNYLSLGLTHQRKKGKGHNNYQLTKNPNSKDNKLSYLRKQIEIGNKKSYSKNKLINFTMSKKDDEYVDEMISKNNKFRKK